MLGTTEDEQRTFRVLCSVYFVFVKKIVWEKDYAIKVTKCKESMALSSVGHFRMLLHKQQNNCVFVLHSTKHKT